METVKLVLCIIGTLWGLKLILGGVTFRTSHGWDMSKNPPEFRPDGLPVGFGLIVLQLVFMGIGVILIYFSFPHLWNLQRLFL